MGEEAKVAVKAAEEAGKILMAHFGRSMEVRDKGQMGIRDLVTQADMESNKKIINILKAEFPDYGIFSEETPEEKSDSGFRWIIDPLDGTHNFTYGIPLFGISIALERLGKIILGVINLPYYKQMFIAEKGKGSLLNGERIGVSRRGIKEAMAVFGEDTHDPGSREATELGRRLEKGTFRMRRFGSAVFHFTCLAMGRVDVYVDIGNKPWDNAAGFLMVEEAGGKVTDFSGRLWDTNTIPFVASNGKIHEEILRIVNQEKA